MSNHTTQVPPMMDIPFTSVTTAAGITATSLESNVWLPAKEASLPLS